MRRIIAVLSVAVLFLFPAFRLPAAEKGTLLYDFTGRRSHGFTGNRDVKSVTPGKKGLKVVCTSRNDPWIEGGPSDKWPQGNFRQLVMELKFYAKNIPSLEVFYGPAFSGANSREISGVRQNAWQTCRVMIPVQPKGSRLRIDPGFGGGTFILSSVRLIPVMPLYRPELVRPVRPEKFTAATLISGKLRLNHGRHWDEYSLVFDGEELACGDSNAFFTVCDGKSSCPVFLKHTPVKITSGKNKLLISCSCRDVAGATWQLTRNFTATSNDTVTVTTSAVPSRDRQVVHFPWLTLFPGFGTFGSAKRQALLPGAEYLLNESSSSELDLRGPNAKRFALLPWKICFPLMALVTPSGKWLSMQWNAADKLLAIFDAPDRRFNSGASLFALWSPGHGKSRLENDLNVYVPELWPAGKVRKTTQTLHFGHGKSVIPAVKAYFQDNELPPLPKWQGGFQSAVSLLGRGWLDSQLSQGTLWRHAVYGDNFKPQPAADALVNLAWIARVTADKRLASRAAARLALCRAPYDRGENVDVSFSHGYRQLESFLYFRAAGKWLKRSRRQAEKTLDSVRPDGSIPCAEKPMAVTHWTDHASGCTADALGKAANAAAASGNPELRRKFLQTVDRVLQCYHLDAPRGAQTWEVPLHTPDILGSAYMLDLCTAAYAVSGNKSYLEAADYWACTALPFIYFTGTSGRPGDPECYASIAVFGASGWVAPYWLGMPVQWCGLVFRNSLIFYEKLLPPGKKRDFWHKISCGLTLSALRQCFRDGRRIGLLPDYYHLPEGVSDGPAINPGTIQNGLPEAFGKGAIFGRYPVVAGKILHLLGSAEQFEIKDGKFSARLKLWPEYPTEVLLSGVESRPESVFWQGKAVKCVFSQSDRALLIKLAGSGTLEIKFAAGK